MRVWEGSRAYWLALAAVSILVLGIADAAAAKVKRTARYNTGTMVRYERGVFTVDRIYTSANSHCRNAPSAALGKFFLTPDSEHGESGSLITLPGSNYIDMQRAGRGHFHLQFPGSASFSTHFPDFSDGGTYTWEEWWSKYVIHLGLPQGDPEQAQYQIRVYGKGGNGRIKGDFKVRYRSGGQTYVVKCVAGKSFGNPPPVVVEPPPRPL